MLSSFLGRSVDPFPIKKTVYTYAYTIFWLLVLLRWIMVMDFPSYYVLCDAVS